MEQNSFLLKKLKQIAIEQGFAKWHFKFLEIGECEKGTIGKFRRCQIVEGERQLSLVCKVLADDDDHNAKFMAFQLFEREVFVYQKLLPEFEKIQLEHGIDANDPDGFWNYPKCFYSNYNLENREDCMIIIEDLKPEGYELRDTFEFSDFLHIKEMFVTLGRLHAISFAMKLKRPDVFKAFRSLNDTMCDVMTTEGMKQLAPRNTQLAANLFKMPEEECVKQKLLSFKNDMWEQIRESLEGEISESHGAILHGDCYLNNVLWKYDKKDPRKIANVKLIDWQMTRYGNVGSELWYFWFINADTMLRRDHQTEIFKFYYESIRKTLNRFELNIDEIYAFEDFKAQLQISGKYAFGMSIFGYPIIRRYPLKLLIDQNTQLTDEETRNVEDYNRDMKETIVDMVKNGLL